MLQHITLVGKYTGKDKRGIIVGGVPFYPGMPLKVAKVNEDTFQILIKGTKNGWFHIEKDNYDKYLQSRFRPTHVAPVEGVVVEPAMVVEPEVVEAPTVKEPAVVEAPAIEEPAVVEEKPVTKKKASKKKATKAEVVEE